jgi:hypothetical protein
MQKKTFILTISYRNMEFDDPANIDSLASWDFDSVKSRAVSLRAPSKIAIEIENAEIDDVPDEDAAMGTIKSIRPESIHSITGNPPQAMADEVWGTIKSQISIKNAPEAMDTVKTSSAPDLSLKNADGTMNFIFTKVKIMIN